jgi:hypothetical protein
MTPLGFQQHWHHFPQEPHISISKVRSYIAVAVILWTDPDHRATQDHLWQELISLGGICG